MGAGSRVKKRLKTATKRLAKAVRPIAGGLPAGGRILTYHRIADRDDELCVPPNLFRAQLQWLKENRPVIPLTDAARGEDGVAITFDDGYRDNWETAAPVLRELDLPATFFVVTGYVDGDAGEDAGPWMDWDHVRALAAAGFEIGAHSHTHRRLALLAEESQESEIQTSRVRIVNETGQVPSGFAYPFGTLQDYTLATEVIVRESGFKYACTNRYGVNHAETDPYNVWRINIDGGDTLADFRAKVNGALDAWRFVDSAVLVRVRQGINRLAGGAQKK